jgi:hypothetical protein
MASTRHRPSGPKNPEHLSTAKPAKGREEKIDQQMADSFPASDPPSFSGGKHVIGAPQGRESNTPNKWEAAKAEAKPQKPAGGD